MCTLFNMLITWVASLMIILWATSVKKQNRESRLTQIHQTNTAQHLHNIKNTQPPSEPHTIGIASEKWLKVTPSLLRISAFIPACASYLKACASSWSFHLKRNVCEMHTVLSFPLPCIVGLAEWREKLIPGIKPSLSILWWLNSFSFTPSHLPHFEDINPKHLFTSPTINSFFLFLFFCSYYSGKVV